MAIVSAREILLDAMWLVTADSAAGQFFELRVDVKVRAAKRAGIRFISVADETTFGFV